MSMEHLLAGAWDLQEEDISDFSSSVLEQQDRLTFAELIEKLKEIMPEPVQIQALRTEQAIDELVLSVKTSLRNGEIDDIEVK